MSLAFAAPWALGLLALLPLLWRLLKVTPPEPVLVRFPAIRLLLGLERREESAASTPPWLLALRLVLMAALILAAARPLLDPAKPRSRADGALIVVVDDGWAAARDWPARQAFLDTMLAGAEREARPGKLKVTLYWMEATRVGDMAAGEMRAIKGWIRDRFGAGKARVLAGYASDVPLAVRQAAGQAGDLYRRVVIAHIDWSHLDDVLTTLEGAIRIDHGKIAMAAATWRSSWPNYSGFRRGHGLRRRRRGRRAGRAPGGRANRAG